MINDAKKAANIKVYIFYNENIFLNIFYLICLKMLYIFSFLDNFTSSFIYYFTEYEYYFF